jgi:hypothetical protein
VKIKYNDYIFGGIKQWVSVDFIYSTFSMDTALQAPFTLLISGSTGSGKTRFIFRLLKERLTMINPPPDRVVYCYTEWQSIYETISGVEFIQGLPKLEIFDPKQNNLLILDDLMNQSDQSVTDIFTKCSHHRNISIAYLIQNLFHKGKGHRTISLNSQYLVLFKNPRDRGQINCLSRQIYPRKPNIIHEAFSDATQRPHGYLLFDFKQSTPEKYRLRTNIFPDETQYVYIPL